MPLQETLALLRVSIRSRARSARLSVRFLTGAVSDTEVAAVGADLLDSELMPIEPADVGAALLLLTDALPTPRDVERVYAWLASRGLFT